MCRFVFSEQMVVDERVEKVSLKQRITIESTLKDFLRNKQNTYITLVHIIFLLKSIEVLFGDLKEFMGSSRNLIYSENSGIQMFPTGWDQHPYSDCANMRCPKSMGSPYLHGWLAQGEQCHVKNLSEHHGNGLFPLISFQLCVVS